MSVRRLPTLIPTFHLHAWLGPPPMSNPLFEENDREIAGLISHERLAAFLAITGTEQHALNLHHQTMLVTGALAPVLGIVEFTLRNAICDRLRQTFGIRLFSPPSRPGGVASRCRAPGKRPFRSGVSPAPRRVPPRTAPSPRPLLSTAFPKHPSRRS